MEQVFFSPGNDCRDTIIRQINDSVSSLLICVFTISDDRISDTLIYKHSQGVNIQVITDNDKCYDLGSDIEKLCKAGIDVRVDKTPYHMHHKFAIIDNKTVLTGSYNWTRSAAVNNHENLILSTEKQVVKKFKQEFEKLWEQMLAY